MTLLATTAATGQPVVYTPRQSTFKLHTLPSAKAVVLRIYNQGTGGKAVKTVEMKRVGHKQGQLATYEATLKGDLKGKFYTLDVKYGQHFLGECPGPEAQAVGVNGQRGAVVDMRDTDPEGWAQDRGPDIAGKDLMIYELHHRDFSIARNINLDPAIHVKRQSSQYPGKYLTLTEPWAINHLKQLGVNAVHLLPSFDFASIDESKPDVPQYNWGYDPLNYNVPEGSYSTNAADPVTRIREFKLMVQALHRAGIKVILDVVYNHMFSIEGNSFQKTMPDAIFRKLPDGSYSNGSACGNETKSEGIFGDYMLRSVKYWVDEYHIDGFRFDLMGVHDIATMNKIRHELPSGIFIYGEGWSAGSCALPASKLGVKANVPKMPGIAAFSDEMRDALRGPFNDDHKGAFLAGIAGEEESIKAGIAGCIAHPQVDYSKVNYSKQPWALQPTQMIAYVSCHDDMCLVDRLRTEMPGIAGDELERLDMLAQTAVFTSQGVPFMLSGEEMMRDKKGVHNSFNSPDSINQLDWNGKLLHPQVWNYYCQLLALRKAHPAFRLGEAELVRRHLEFLPTQDCVVAFCLKDHAGGDNWNNIYVVLNARNTPARVEVPQGWYTVVAAGGKIDAGGMGTFNGSAVEVAPQSALIMHQ